MTNNSHFIIREGFLTNIDASIYENRQGYAESNIHSMVFDNGESIDIKATFFIELDNIDIKMEDENGRVNITVYGKSRVQIFNKEEILIFEGSAIADKDSSIIIIDNNLINQMKLVADFNGEGKNIFNGKTISGKITVEITEFDESCIGICRLSGEGNLC